MKTKIFLSVLLSLNFCLLSSQVPQGFNYQAIARDGSGNPITTTIQVKTGFQTDTLSSEYIWEELHSTVKPNSAGLFSLVIGVGSRLSGALAFTEIDWTKTPIYFKVSINPGSGWKYMGASQLWSVPYSMIAGDLGGAVKKLEVMGEDVTSDEALFEVKRKDGETMFAVYNHGVRVYMPLDTLSKTRKGGFAIGGFSKTKGTVQDYFVVNPDSIRAYIDTNPAKARKGGFAIGGFDKTKTGNEEYLRVTRDSTRIYVNESSKGIKGGFAIGGFSTTKGEVIPFTSLTPENYFIGQKSGIKNTTGIHNSFVGYETGINNTSGRKNVFLGYHAGLFNDTASYNVFIGNEAGVSNRFGRYNTFLGYQSGWTNSNANNNVFLGYKSGYTNNGANNVFLGVESGYSNTVGTTDAFIGFKAGRSNTTGSANVFVGNLSGYSNSTGRSNVVIGDQAGYLNLTGNYNVLVGYQAGYSNLTNENTFLGYQAGYMNTTGGYNSFMGYRTGYSNTSGFSNIFIGIEAGYLNKTGNRNVIIGDQAGLYSNGSGNTFLGHQVGVYNTIGEYNVFLGESTGLNNTEGSKNVFVGTNAGFKNSTGSFNVAIGNEAGSNFTNLSNQLVIGTYSGLNMADPESYGNTFLGNFTGVNIALSKANTFVGYYSGNKINSGWDNVYVGCYTGGSGTSSHNILIGSYTGYNLGAENNANVFIGSYSGFNNTGSGNVFIGNFAGIDETGSNKLLIANSANPPIIYGDFSTGRVGLGTTAPKVRLNTIVAANTEFMTLGTPSGGFKVGNVGNTYGILMGVGNSGNGWIQVGRTDGTAAAYNLVMQSSGGNVGIGTTSPSYKLQVGNAADGTQARANAWNLLSDVSLKSYLMKPDHPLELIKNINGYYFYWNTGSDKTRQFGFSAQEVEKILPEIVSKGDDGLLSLDYGKITPLLVEAIKEQQQQIETYKSENDILKSRLQSLQERIEQIEAMLAGGEMK